MAGIDGLCIYRSTFKVLLLILIAKVEEYHPLESLVGMAR
jgi:hypothetical protein